jgi:2-polyprenyl-3-methyl-5-hydroxy-6-metoxy-1,4-benzoquinol methylase
MNTTDKKNHWESIYTSKQLNEVSWYQPTPTTSLDYVNTLKFPLDAAIIDVGGGDSFFIDHLIELGYTNLTVLDISETAIERAKKRLGEKASLVNWVVSDILDFKSESKFDFWHDRAVFHFITQEEEIKKYKGIALKHLAKNATIVIGTFSTNGPQKCSGIPIKQYTETSLNEVFSPELQLISTQHIEHTTPFDTIQQFVFCCFKKNE